MKLIKSNPTSNGVRHQLKIQKNLLSKINIVKTLTFGFKQDKGRSVLTGRITSWTHGGGCKKKFRHIELNNSERMGIVLSVFYDPFRSSFVSLIFDLNNHCFFNTLATSTLYPGSLFVCSKYQTELKLGYRTSLKNIPTGSILHSLSLDFDKETKFVRSAGTSCQIIQKGIYFCKIRLPSGNIINVSIDALATIGVISNNQNNQIVIGKAGKNRLRGIRPSVRGIAMNPVDHPHGGRTNGGQPSVTPWGIPTKGKPTVKKKQISYE